MSCQKIAKDIHIQDISYSGSYDLTNLYLIDPSNYVVIGGSVWEEGVRLSTSDAGMSWVKDSIGNKALLSLFVNEDGSGCSGGVDGYFYTFDQVLGDWTFHRLPYWDMLQSLYFKNDFFYLAYGQSFGYGRILNLNSNLEETGNFETTGQLSTVTCGSTECIVAGFGEFWIGSALTGVWKAKDVPGEFYTDLHQVSDSLIFACGIGGSIIKSEDGGANWNTLIKGSKFWSANAAFKAISFVDSNTGLVVGEHGLCRITYDGGNSWQTINNLPPVDFNDVAVFENTGIIVGAEGSIIRIDWP